MNTAVELGAGDVTGTAGESEGIAGQTRRIPGSAGRLPLSPSNPHACTPLRAKRQPAEWVSAAM